MEYAKWNWKRLVVVERLKGRQRQIKAEFLTQSISECRWMESEWKERAVKGMIICTADLEMALSLPQVSQYRASGWADWVCKRGMGRVNAALCLAWCLPLFLLSQACRERPSLRPSCLISSFHLRLYPSILALALRGIWHEHTLSAFILFSPLHSLML